MDNKLFLNFHGRIIDHLGIQMYQSPTAAIAEMVSNAGMLMLQKLISLFQQLKTELLS
jgi:hypothetical protein